MPSKVLYYDGQEIHTKDLHEFVRALAWDWEGNSLILIGNRGLVLKIQNDMIESLDLNTRANLRAVSVNPADGRTLIVGNAGTAILLDGQRKIEKLTLPTFENLRTVSWNSDGSSALMGGNNGTLLKYSQQEIEALEAGRSNVRHISWHPKSRTALIVSNCFAEEFIPSPNLHMYDEETATVKPLNEGRADLIGVDWKPTGELALVVGYDVIWHNGFLASFEGSTLSPIRLERKRVYPVAIAWHKSAPLAAIVTSTSQMGVAKGAVFLWENNSLNEIYSHARFFFSDVGWNDNGMLAAVASTKSRTFNS